jgi:hypothetical protein
MIFSENRHPLFGIMLWVVPMIDAAGVDRVVIVPPTLEGDRVDYGQEAARRYPGRSWAVERPVDTINRIAARPMPKRHM